MSDAPNSANQGIDKILAQIRQIISDEPEFAKPSGAERRQNGAPELPPATPLPASAHAVVRKDAVVAPAPAVVLPAVEVPATTARRPEPLVDDFSDLLESPPVPPGTLPLAVAQPLPGAPPSTGAQSLPLAPSGPLPTPAQPSDAACPTVALSMVQSAVLQTLDAPAVPPAPVPLPKPVPPPLPGPLSAEHATAKRPSAAPAAVSTAARSLAAAVAATLPAGPQAQALALAQIQAPAKAATAPVASPELGELPSVRGAAAPSAAVPAHADTQIAVAVAAQQAAPGAPLPVQSQRMQSTAPPVFGEIDKRGKAPTSLADLLAGGLSLPGVAPSAATSAKSIALPRIDQSPVAVSPKVQSNASALGDLAAGLAATTGDQVPPARPPQPQAPPVSVSAKIVVTKELEDKILAALRPTVRQWLDANADKLGDTADKN